MCLSISLFAWVSQPQAAVTQTAPSHETVTDPIASCSLIGDDHERLICYDGVARRTAVHDAKAILLLDSDAGAVPSIDPVVQTLKPRPAVRVELGFSGAIGNYAGASKLSGDGTLEVNAATGGEGGGLTAEAWLDNWPRKDFSIGMGYLQINNRGVIDASLPHGILILTDPVEARLGVAAQADLVLFDLAYRPAGFGAIRPVAGMGLGVGYGTGVVDTLVSNPFIGASISHSRSGSIFPAIEAFTGVEADLGRSAYISILPRLLIASAHPVGINQRYTDLMVNVTIGYRLP